MTDFSDWLTKKMSERDYSFRDLAMRMERDGEGNVSNSKITRWRTGSRPNKDDVIRIARVFGEDPLDLLTLAGHGRPDDRVYILQTMLTPDEETIVKAYRLGVPEIQESLLATARVGLRFQTSSDAEERKQEG